MRTLPNGLRLIVREQHGAALVAVDVWLRAGSGREGPEESGAAHFLEHLLFKGTPSRKPGEIDAAIENLGATLNAGTTRDGAHFYTTVATPYLETALEVLSDALQHAALDPAEMERERAIILDEIARSRNDRRKQAINRLYAALCPKEPYGRPILGDSESIRTLSCETVRAFYRRLYTPDNAVVVLVGDLTPEAAQAAVARAFGDWKARGRGGEEAVASHKSQVASSDTHDSRLTTHASRPDAPSAVALGARVGTAEKAEDVALADVLAMLLADPAGGRLGASLGARGLASEVGADYATTREPGVLALYAACAPDRVETVRKTLADEMDRLRKEAVSAGELEFAKRRVIGAYLFDIETYAGQARTLGFYETTGSYRLALDYPDLILKRTPQDVLNFAGRYFDPARRAEVVTP